ncbi:MAG: AAA family ATPase [Candidatus Thorarchaeota archaeon]
MHVKKAVIFCGMPGSGKSIGADVGKDLGIQVFVMGDIVREEVTRLKLPHTPQSLAQVMLDLRNQFGPSVVADRCIAKFSDMTVLNLIIDGVRSEAELTAFKQAIEQVTVVAVHASPKMRFTRLQNRRRADDALTLALFHERDARELDVGLGRVIAQADIMIVNEGDFNQIQTQVRNILKAEFNLD